MITYHQVLQGSEEWQNLREGLYTGSNADKLLKFGTIDYALSQANTFKSNFWTERGHMLEEEALELYANILKVSVERVGFVTNDKYPDCGFSPDGLSGNHFLLEVKCFDEPEHRKLLAGEIPFKVLAQIHFGLFITDRSYANLIAYNPKMKEVKDKFKIIPIAPKRSIIANFRRILK